MKKIGKRIGGCTVFLLLGASLLAGIAVLPKPVPRAASAAENATLSAMFARNEKLVVKYGLDEVKDGKISASKWDTETKTYVADTAADATVVYEQNGKATGTVNKVEGVEGGNALSFSGIAHGRASVHLPQDAEGMTISIWVKNITTYWGSLAEFWDGTKGGRFGKGTLQLTQGQPFTWGYSGSVNGNCPSYDPNKCVGSKSSFVTEMNTGDAGDGPDEDLMAKEQWYQVTFTMTENEFKAYRDGELKQTFKKYNSAADNNITDILKNTLAAAKNQTSGMFGLRLGNDDTGDRADILDDFRIYSGAMTQEEITGLYNEYKGIKAIHGKTVKLEGETSEFAADNGGGLYFTSDADPFPKILIGGVEASGVTEAEGTYSAAGSGFSYTYTVGELVGKQRTATVTYTAGGESYVFEITQIKKKVVRLSSLKIKINGGEAEEIEGFKPETTEYSVTLSPDTYEVEFEVAVADGGSSNLAEVNAEIDYNGKNVITTQAAAEAEGESLSYTVTFKRERADTALPSVKGLQLDYAAQVVYTDDAPETIAQEEVVLVYPNGVTVEDFSYDGATHVLTFTLKDKVTTDTTAYQVSYKAKKEGQVAHWSFDESADRSTFKGSGWDDDTNGLKENSSLDMTVRSGGWRAELADNKNATQGTLVDGVSGKGLELPAWGYTTATLPAQGGTTGFTFSVWMKTSGIVWEAIFTVGSRATGDDEWATVLEKGNMQRQKVVNGQPKFVDDGFAENAGNGRWLDPSCTNDDAKKAFYNSSSDYVFYTVTVTYENGKGVVKFYKNGELAVVHEDDSSATNKARILINAFNAGASVGLHRHYYDSDPKSTFDEADVYAYAMTAEEVKASYNTIAEFLAAAPAYYDVEGLGYPDLKLGGAENVTDEGGLKKGVTSSGIEYTYTPVTEAATPALDEQGVTVTLKKNGMTRTATVKFRRTLKIEAESIGYKVDGGPNIPVEFESAGKDIVVRVSADADLSKIGEGDLAVKKLAEDDAAEHYKTTFSYNAETHTATVRCSYTVYPAFDTVYTLRFVKKSTETFTSLKVTADGKTQTLTPDDFGTEKTAEFAVRDAASFSVTVEIDLAEGAAAKDTASHTYTQADLDGGKLAITVTNENGEEVTYYLKPVARSADATLSALSAGEYRLSPEFSAEETEYTVTVGKGEGAKVFAALSFTPADGNATAEERYDASGKIITVTVTAEDGTVKVYTIAIIEKDTDATLSGITVGGVPVEGFDPAVTSYTVKYKGDTLPEVKGTATSENASVSAGAPESGVVTITVTAESGKTAEYTVRLVKMSSDATLIKLTLNGTAVTIEEGEGSYTAPAGTAVGSIVVSCETAEGAHALWKFEGNTLLITVTAEDGTEKEYTVTVTVSAGELPGGAGTEDNSPKGGCGGTLSGVGCALALLVGAGLLVGVRKREHGKGEENDA